ncbi:hypothetical protein AgCh_034936 [Apium graveolens]
MAQSNWEADKMLDVYIYDYLLKRNLQTTAKAFMIEAKVANDPVAIDAPGGFLFEWWSVFWDIFIARTNEKHSEPAASYIETQQSKAREHQQQLQLMQQRSAPLQRRDPNHSPLGGPVNAMNSEGMIGQPSASILAMKMYEEQMKHPHPVVSDASPAQINAQVARIRSAANQQGQSVHANSGSMPGSMQHMRPQMANTEVNLGNQKSFPSHPPSIYGQAILQSQSGSGGAGLNQGLNGLPLKGWPLTGIDQLRPNSGLQVPRPNLQNQNQFVLASPNQQALAQAQAQGGLGNSPNYGFGGLPRGGLNVKDAQHMKMTQIPQSSSQQHEQLPQQQLQQTSSRKRKPHSSSGPANSNGTGNTAGPSPNSPASTHTLGDGLTTASSLQHVSSGQKGLMYGTETAGLASSANHLDDIEHFGDVDSFFSNDVEDGRSLYGTVKQNHTEHKTESSKGFSFGEVGCIRTRNKVTGCHFSSDGKLLASAGHDYKAVIWNMDTLQTESTPKEHENVITDVRFRPNTTQLLTASYDQSVRLWDAANPSYCLHAYTGHNSPVISLDFHPKKNDTFCFCDSNNEIRYWNISPFSCTRVSKQGGNSQVRFQPISGRLLAAASDKVVSIFDVETDMQTHSFQVWHLMLFVGV